MQEFPVIFQRGYMDFRDCRIQRSMSTVSALEENDDPVGSTWGKHDQMTDIGWRPCSSFQIVKLSSALRTVEWWHSKASCLRNNHTVKKSLAANDYFQVESW